MVCNMILFKLKSSYNSSNPQGGSPPLVVCPPLLIIFAATLHVGGRSSLPQPEDVPCRGDQDPLILGRLDWWHKSRLLD